VIGGASAGRLLHLLRPKGKLVTYGVVSGKPMELPGSLLIWNQLSVEGFFEGHPQCAGDRQGVSGESPQR
jgi:NADPH:quinone reductase-like Zn-dependent oxidoreductase